MLAVILSEAKDLMPLAIGDEVLRYAQDDGEAHVTGLDCGRRSFVA